MAAHQTKLNVIGNNIANVNTYGFKASRVVFSDVLYQNLSTATEATNTTGGTNASQLGYGAKVASIDMLNTVSSGATTGRALDVYIAGEGYLTVQPTAGANRYTRVGNLKFDAAGNLTDGAGSKVMGIPTVDGNPVLDANGTLKMDGLTAINVPAADLEKYTGITIGKSGEITGIRAGDPEFTINATSKGWLKSANIQPTSNYTGDLKMAIGELGTFTEDATAKGVTFNNRLSNIEGELTLTSNAGVYTLRGFTRGSTATDPDFNVVGTLKGTTLTFDTDNDGTVDLTIEDPQTNYPTAADDYTLGEVELDDEASILATVTNRGGVSETFTVAWDSEDTEPTNNTLTIGTGTDAIVLTIDPAEFLDVYEAGMTNTTIGKIEAGSDTPVTLGYLAISKFANNDGLLQDGNGYFMESANSGEALASKAGTNGTGGTESSNLEMSNVDLSQEFTDMIVAQRGFQANSRIITVSDSILEELINLKR